MAKVLIAEDDRHIRELLVDTLFDGGYDIIEAKNGGVALEKALQERPDLILLDVWMPVLDGFQVLEKLREAPDIKDVPVVMLTAMPVSQGERKGMLLGVDHYITKLWNPKTVELTVKVALREAKDSLAKQEEGSVVWAGSTANRRTPDDPASRKFIKGDDSLALLEQKLGSGIPLGSLTLVEGAMLAGKSVLCQHLVHGSLMDRHGVAYFTSEYTPNSLLKQMESIGLDVSKAVGDGEFDIYAVQEPIPDEDCGPLLAALARDVERVPKKYDLIIIDTITQLAIYSQGTAIVGFFSSLRRLCSRGKAVIVVVHSYAFDDRMLVRVRDLCDTHLKMGTGKIRSKVLFMTKLIKANNVKLDRDNLISFEVEPGAGIRIIPYTQAKA